MKASKFPNAILAEMGSGLGNQINIYAAAKRLSIEKGVPLYLDILWFDSWPKYMVPRSFGLDKFNTNIKIASKKQVSRYLYKTKFRYLNKIFRKLGLFEKRVYYEHRDFNGPEEFFALPNDVYLRGYYNKDYWDDIKDMLVSEFRLKDEYRVKIKDLLKEIDSCESVSVHVRRGDFLKLKGAYALPAEYYKRAIEITSKKLKNPKFYIFSQDAEWFKKNLGLIKNAVFIEGNPVEQDFELMKSCKHNITANSSLSWWAAYLNKNSKKIIIAPRVFAMIPGKNFDYGKKIDGNIPEGWMQI